MKKLFSGLLLLFAVSAAYAGATTPFPDTIYVRGGFNDWGLASPMDYNPGPETYTADIDIAAGTYEFKIANESWDNPDFGPTGDPIVTLGVATDIGTAIGANFSLALAEAGIYRFTLFDLGPVRGSPTSGQLLVSRVVPIPAAGLLMLSALGGLGFLRRRR